MVVPIAIPSLLTLKYWKVTLDANIHDRLTCPVTSFTTSTVRSVAGVKGSPKIVIVTGIVKVPTSGVVEITISAV